MYDVGKSFLLSRFYTTPMKNKAGPVEQIYCHERFIAPSTWNLVLLDRHHPDGSMQQSWNVDLITDTEYIHSSHSFISQAPYSVGSPYVNRLHYIGNCWITIPLYRVATGIVPFYVRVLF